MGSFFFDLLATFPFFLIKTGSDSNYGLYFKLIRLTRIPKIYRLLDMDKFTKLSDALFAGTARGKRVVFQNVLKNIYRVLRLIFMTILITYFMGCIFYFISTLQTN
jgi:hypothetical protein